MNKYSGILLPIYSLPSDYGIGDFGPSAYHFIDLLVQSGQTIWSVLPLNPTGFGNSPYKSPSIFAGNPYFISLDLLVQEGLLKKKDVSICLSKATSIDYDGLFNKRLEILKKAYKKWTPNKKQLTQFRKEHSFWLKDFCLFMAIKVHFNLVNWNEWPTELKQRHPSAIKEIKDLLAEDISVWEFIQFKFFEQWKQLAQYAKEKGIKLMGDMPYYVDFDSADVWMNRNLFCLTQNKEDIALLSGVPGGDDFSHKDRVWGHPCYDWNAHKKSGYKWFLERFKQASKMFDILRFDHALGLIQFYGIQKQGNQFHGEWYEGPCMHDIELIEKIKKVIARKLKIVVEDLGSHTRRANELFEQIGWNSMRVLQFAATGKYGFDNTHLPHRYHYKTIAYTGTHDNPTLAGFLSQHHPTEFDFIRKYLGLNQSEDLRWAFIKSVYESASEFVIIPLQDILGLSNEARHSFGKEFYKSWKWKLTNFNEFKKRQSKLLNLSLSTNRVSQEVAHDN